MHWSYVFLALSRRYSLLDMPEKWAMMTSWHGNAFHITGPLWGETTAHWRIPSQRTSDAEFQCFLWWRPEQTVEIQLNWDLFAGISLVMCPANERRHSLAGHIPRLIPDLMSLYGESDKYSCIGLIWKQFRFIVHVSMCHHDAGSWIYQHANLRGIDVRF